MREFSRYRRNTRIKHHPLLAIDFENNPITGEFICAGLVGEYKYKAHEGWKVRSIREYFDNLDLLQSRLLELKRNSCLLTFFNAGYDKAFIPSIIKHDTVIQNGGRLITMELVSGLKCFDLTNHVSGSLEDWIGYLNMGLVKPGLENLKERVMIDAEATFILGKFLEDFYTKELNVAMKLTAPSTALRLFAQNYFTDYWHREDSQDWIGKLERYAYYGGRCEIYKKGKHQVKSYDVNSMYLSVMRDSLIPDMASYQYIENGRDWRDYFDRFPGIYHCRVFAPDIGIQILPYRSCQGKLLFPSGRFEGWWTSVELAEALRHGYEVEQMFDFIYYRKSKPYFNGYADLIWSKRQEYKAKGNVGMEQMIKKLGNSLYGKFGQLNQSTSYEGALRDAPKLENPSEHRWCYYKHPVTGEDWVTIYGIKTGEPPKFEFPAVCAFITSYARVRLYRAMEANQARIVYCDTDSIKLEGEAEAMVIGDGLGEWGFEGEGEFTFYKPKWYGDKCKGVPKRAKLVGIVDGKAQFTFDKPLKEREALRRGEVPNKWITMSKFLSMIDDKRCWRSGTSHPLMLDMINDYTFVDYAGMDMLFGIDLLSYKEKLRYGGKQYERSDDMSEADRGLLELEKLERRREGSEIYQRKRM